MPIADRVGTEVAEQCRRIEQDTGANLGMRGVEATLIGEPAEMVVIAPDDRPRLQRHALAVHRSRKRIAPFRLHIPTSAPEALSLLRERPRACVLAGGIDVVNRMKSGDEPEDVVYIGRIDSLRRIEQSQDVLRIGATCTHHELASSPITARAAPALPSVWGSLASPRIRFKGTVGGNLMANESAYEGPSILSAMGADLRFLTPAGVRVVSCVEYFRARRQDPTRQEPTWLLEAVVVPCNHAIRLDYDRSFKGVAGVVLALAIAGDVVVGARAAATWAFPRPCCADLPIEQPTPIATLSGRAGMLARAWASALPEPTTDHLATGGYRRRIIEVHLRRALERAAQGGAA